MKTFLIGLVVGAVASLLSYAFLSNYIVRFAVALRKLGNMIANKFNS